MEARFLETSAVQVPMRRASSASESSPSSFDTWGSQSCLAIVRLECFFMMVVGNNIWR